MKEKQKQFECRKLNYMEVEAVFCCFCCLLGPCWADVRADLADRSQE